MFGPGPISLMTSPSSIRMNSTRSLFLAASVFVTRGILEQIADEAELSIVLGHEITHIAGWHGIEMLQRAGLLSTLTALGTIGGIAMGAGEAAIAIAQAAGVYENLYLGRIWTHAGARGRQTRNAYASKAGYDLRRGDYIFPAPR